MPNYTAEAFFRSYTNQIDSMRCLCYHNMMYSLRMLLIVHLSTLNSRSWKADSKAHSSAN